MRKFIKLKKFPPYPIKKHKKIQFSSCEAHTYLFIKTHINLFFFVNFLIEYCKPIFYEAFD